MGFHRKINVGFLAGNLPLGELRLCEGTVGDEVHPEDLCVLAVSHLQADVGSVLDDFVDLGCFYDLQHFTHSVHRTLDWMVANTDSDEASYDGLLEDGEMTKSVQFVPRETDGVQLCQGLDIDSFLNMFLGAVSLCVGLTGGFGA